MTTPTDENPLPLTDWRDPATIRYGRMLVLLTASFLVSAFSEPWAVAVMWALNIGIIVAAFRLTRLTSSRARMITLVGVSVAALPLWLATGTRDDLRGIAYMVQFVLLALIAIAVMGSILRRGRVDGQTLIGATAAYVLIGLTFSWLFLAVDVWDDNQFNLNPEITSDYAEFSFIVMTTIGFGNQLPTAAVGARLVVIEALIAQLFLATFVARMVSMYGRHRDNQPSAD